jgi:alanine-synthesizing transaminase
MRETVLTDQLREIMAADRLENVQYAIRDLAVLAEQLVEQGHKITWLNIGDPLKFDFTTPPHMVEAVYRAMRDGKNGYAASMGVPEALEAIRAEADRKGIRNVQSVFVTLGASEAVDVCLTALVNPGDNVLTPSPEYPLYSAVLGKIEGKVNAYALDESTGWMPDFADIERRINKRTKAIVVINPNNPTGALYGRETLERLIDIARRHHLIIFADEIYDKLLLDEGSEHISIASLAPDLPMVTFNGISKSYLAPGWRIGWGIASGDAAAIKPYLDGVHQLLRARLCAGHPQQWAIKPALEGPQDHIRDATRRLRKRRDLTMQWCGENERASCVAPQAAFYAFPRLDIPEDDKTFVEELLRQKHVLLVHGSGFGQQEGTRHCRIVFLPGEPTLHKAYAAMSEFMRERYT